MPSLPVLPAPTPADLALERDAALPAPLPPAQRDHLAREFTRAVAGEVRFDHHNRMLYATDASIYQVEPLGVFIPASTDDIVHGLRFCATHHLPVLPRGGGTSLAGQCTNRAVVFDVSPACRAVLRVDPDQREAEVEPGITVDDLNDALAPSGLFFAPDPATSKHATVGGCIGNNAAGARSIVYGRTSESLLGVDVAFADGFVARLEPGAASRHPRLAALTRRIAEIVLRHRDLIRARFPRTVRRNAGYNLDLILNQLEAAGATTAQALTPAQLDAVNLAHLVCGSEGTLAVTLRARLRLHPRPGARGLSVLGFASLDEAIAAVVPILSTTPSAVELLDDTVIDLARANTEYRKYVELMPAPTHGTLKAVLYCEYSAPSAAELPAAFESLARVITAARIDTAQHNHTAPAAMLQAWKLRKAGEPLLHGIPGLRKPLTFVEDNAVPVERLSEFVRRFRSIVAQHGTVAAFYAHASVGVLHVRPLLNLHDEHDRARLRAIAVEIADLARELGGVMSGEHGDGRVRSPLLPSFYGPELLAAMAEIKRAFDPDNRLNPGNIVNLAGPHRPLASITESMRIKPASVQLSIPHVDTFFSYADQHGFDAAVEMCNGSGVCRKKSGGTMCPSYMATLDERHSTRGRGNALRLAISGQLSGVPESPAWDDPGTTETLNLCLSCKACKTECPSNVDVARLKAEYTAQRYRHHGVPLAARLFGHVRELGRLASLTPALTNFINRLPLTRAVLARFARIDRRRTLPPYAASLARDFPRDLRAAPGLGEAVAAAPIVALFGDCFTMFNEPRIGRAARAAFAALGYETRLADAGCCGRALISTGLLPEAIETIDATLARLRPWIQSPAVRAIVVAEPSCLSAFKDDWLQLKLRTPMTLRTQLAAKAMLPEEFIARWWGMHPHQELADRAAALAPARVILHGHCHQKALWGAETSAAALRRFAQVEALDSGCCGMAGSFGYTQDRFDVSQQIGELVLFPALRRNQAAAAPAHIVMPGTSCRHQVHDALHAAAQHPIEFIADRLAAAQSTART